MHACQVNGNRPANASKLCSASWGGQLPTGFNGCAAQAAAGRAATPSCAMHCSPGRSLFIATHSAVSVPVHGTRGGLAATRPSPGDAVVDGAVISPAAQLPPASSQGPAPGSAFFPTHSASTRHQESLPFPGRAFPVPSSVWRVHAALEPAQRPWTKPMTSSSWARGSRSALSAACCQCRA